MDLKELLPLDTLRMLTKMMGSKPVFSVERDAVSWDAGLHDVIWDMTEGVVMDGAQDHDYTPLEYVKLSLPDTGTENDVLAGLRAAGWTDVVPVDLFADMENDVSYMVSLWPHPSSAMPSTTHTFRSRQWAESMGNVYKSLGENVTLDSFHYEQGMYALPDMKRLDLPALPPEAEVEGREQHAEQPRSMPGCL